MAKASSLHGVDGCNGGWVVAESDANVGDVSFRFVPSLEPLFRQAGPERVIAIDIPIGLPKCEPRVCDTVARQLLGRPRSSSVFSPPARQALQRDTSPEPFRMNHEQLNIGISKQTFFIMPKIREVDALMDRQRQQFVRAAHTAESFAQRNGVRATLHYKKAIDGRSGRITI